MSDLFKCLLLLALLMTYGFVFTADAEIKDYSDRDVFTEEIIALKQLIPSDIKQAEQQLQKLSEQLSADLTEHYRDDINILKAFLLLGKGQWQAAKDILNPILERVTPSSSQFLLGNLYDGLGQVYEIEGDFSKSIEFFLKALTAFESLNDIASQAALLNSIAIIYYRMERVDLSEEFFLKAIHVFKALNSELKVAIILGNLGIIYTNQKRYQKALNAFYESQSLREKLQDNQGLYLVEAGLGRVYYETSKIKRSINYFESALKRLDNQTEHINFNRVKCSLGRSYFKDQQIAKAKVLTQEALEQAITQNYNDIAHSCREILIEILIAQENYKLAYEEQLKREAYLQKQINENYSDKLAQYEAKYASSEKEKEIIQLKKQQVENKIQALEQKYKKDSLLAVTLIVIVTCLFLVFRYRARIKNQADLTAKNKELEKAYHAVNKLAQTDMLTGLLNRRALTEKVLAMKSENKRLQKYILLMDVDHFKHINDTYGHDMGDEVLVETAHRIKRCLKEEELCCRWGGEEFVVILNETSENAILKRAETIRKSVSKPMFTLDVIDKNHQLIITLSIGISRLDLSNIDFQVAVKQADIALYECKKLGRNRVHLDSPIVESV